MTSELDIKKLYWHSRRGMLELDLILIPFVENRLADMDLRYQHLYRELLDQEDQDIYAWLVTRRAPPTESLRTIVDVILER